MPGVLGVVQRRGEEARDGALSDGALTGMLRPMLHRDSYRVRTRVLPDVALGAIAVRDHGEDTQLVTSGDQRFTLVFDGHLDNAPELRTQLGQRNTAPASTAAAVLLEGFERWGTDLFERLNGAFQIAVWDAHERELVVATDPGGLRALYYAQSGDRFAFAPEVKALLALPWISRAADFAGISSFLQHGFPLGDHTFFKDVTLLPGACYGRLKDGAFRVQRYFRMRLSEISALREAEAVDVFVETWKDVLRRQTDDGLRIGALLSGGLDSRAILAGLLAIGRNPATFTFGEEGCADSRTARQIASIAGCHHRFSPVDSSGFATDLEEVVRLTDGMFNYVHSDVRHVVPDLAREVDVAFDGITLLDSFLYAAELPVRRLMPGGADELRWLRLALMNGGDPRAIRIGAAAPVSLLSGIPELATPFATDQYLRDYANTARDVASTPFSLLGLFDMELRQRRFTSFGPALMRSAVEVRCPFFDKRIIELGAFLSARYRSKDKILQARTIERLSPPLVAVPWLRTGLPVNASSLAYYGRLGRRRVRSRLTRFARNRLGLQIREPAPDTLIDHARVLREQPEVRSRIEAILTQPSPRDSGFFDPDAIRHLLDHHVAGHQDHSEMIGRLLTIETWHRTFH